MQKYQERPQVANFLARVVQYKHGDASRLGSTSCCWRQHYLPSVNTCFAHESSCTGTDDDVSHVRVEILSSREALGRSMGGALIPYESGEKKKLRMGGRRELRCCVQTQEISAMHA